MENDYEQASPSASSSSLSIPGATDSAVASAADDETSHISRPHLTSSFVRDEVQQCKFLNKKFRFEQFLCKKGYDQKLAEFNEKIRLNNSSSDIQFDYNNYFYVNNSEPNSAKIELSYLDYFSFNSRLGQVKRQFNIELDFFTSLKNLRLAYLNKNIHEDYQSKQQSLSLLPTLIETNEMASNESNESTTTLNSSLNKCILCVLNLNLDNPKHTVLVNKKKFCKYCYYFFYNNNYNSAIRNMRLFAESKRYKSDEYLDNDRNNSSHYEFKSFTISSLNNTTTNATTNKADDATSYSKISDNDKISSMISFNGAISVKTHKHNNGSLTDISSLDGSLNYSDSFVNKKRK